MADVLDCFSVMPKKKVVSITERGQLITSLKGGDMDSKAIKVWIDEFFIDKETGKTNSANLSHIVRIAIVHTYIDPNVPVDTRYRMPDYDADNNTGLLRRKQQPRLVGQKEERFIEEHMTVKEDNPNGKVFNPSMDAL
jgi:hypothetical protein